MTLSPSDSPRQTFLGIKIVQLLLHNASSFSPPPSTPHRSPHPSSPTKDYLVDMMDSSNSHLGPILCVCFTNHALDQFLEGLLAAGIKKVRGKGSPLRVGRSLQAHRRGLCVGISSCFPASVIICLLAFLPACLHAPLPTYLPASMIV